jgi:hypothetical protein
MWTIVDGMNLRNGMQRFVGWLKEPVDNNPPAYAKVRGHKEDNSNQEGGRGPSSKL